MNKTEWLENWNAKELFADKVSGSNTCADGPVIKEKGIVCGPVLRLINVDYQKKLYRGSMLIVVRGDVSAPHVTFEMGPSLEIEQFQLTGGEFSGTMFYSENDLKFYRYSIEITMTEHEQMCKYAIDGEALPQYRFFVPSYGTNFNTISVSCNGFSLAVDTTQFKGSMWYDILKKHGDVHYNVILGGGDQIYSDSIKLYCKSFGKWLQTKDPLKKYGTKCSQEMSQEINAFYLKEYLEWFGYGHWKGSTENSRTTQRCFPIATATIPSINIFDDHDIIDGYGSYSASFMSTDVFKTVGKSAYKYYMLFQHHTSVDESEAHNKEACWVLGAQPGDYIGEKSHSVYTRIGPDMAVLGIDCRTERKLAQICSEKTYDILFNRVTADIKEKKLDHLLVMLGVPIAYPRLVWLELLFSSKFLAPLKWLSKKGIIARGLVNEFNGDVELLDDLNDHWCAHYHKKERNYLIARLQDFAAYHGIRITILSGDVHLAALGRFRSKIHTHHITSAYEEHDKQVIEHPELDGRLMFNVISSAVVNTPPPDPMATLLQKRSKYHHFDRETDEDSVPIFTSDVDGEDRDNDSFMNRRNWSDIIPVANILKNSKLNRTYNFAIGDTLIPGVVGTHTEVTEDTEINQTPYPVTEKGVVATIHVEKDTTSLASETVGYNVVIPELQKSGQKLSHVGIKHLNLT